MRTLIIAAAILTALCGSALADRHKNDWDITKHYSGAPGPIAGAGLPLIAAGYGVYWLVRRYRRRH